MSNVKQLESDSLPLPASTPVATVSGKEIGQTIRWITPRRAIVAAIGILSSMMIGFNLYVYESTAWSHVPSRSNISPNLISGSVIPPPSDPRPLRKKFITSGISPKPTVPLSLVITCQEEDLYLLPLVTESLANQTVYPVETIFVLNLSPAGLKGISFTELDFTPEALSNKDDAKAEAVATLRALNNFTANVTLAKEYILNTRANIEDSLLEIPHLQIMVRGGRHYAGSNRMFGARKAREDVKLISFWDCDDYLHPLRTEYVFRTFEIHPELEALIHGYYLLRFTRWDADYGKFSDMFEYMPNNRSFFHSYETIQRALPKNRFKQWPRGEPPQNKSGHWWYPRYMRLPSVAPYPQMGHNGWLTIKPHVLHKIKYPEDVQRGQDSLYNWRLLVNKVKFNVLPLRIGAYVRPR